MFVESTQRLCHIKRLHLNWCLNWSSIEQSLVSSFSRPSGLAKCILITLSLLTNSIDNINHVVLNCNVQRNKYSSFRRRYFEKIDKAI